MKRVGVWPVGLVGGLNAEAPIIDGKTGMFEHYKFVLFQTVLIFQLAQILISVNKTLFD